MVDKSQDRERVKTPTVKTPTDKDTVTDIKNAFAELLVAFQAASPKPIPFTFLTERPSQAQKELMLAWNERLVGKRRASPTGICYTPISVAFPQCSDVLLAHVKIYEGTPPVLKIEDDLTGYFDDYFSFCDHRIIYRDEQLRSLLDPLLVGGTPVGGGDDIDGCLEKWFPTTVTKCDTPAPAPVPNGCPPLFVEIPRKPLWPPPYCLPPSCITLRGKRHLYTKASTAPGPSDRIRRLFIGDLVWLFYFERMGIFKILGVILDDFATQGKMPISNGTVFPNVMDDVIAIILESMVRETKTGLSSTVRDRDSSYRRCLGWTSDVGRKLDSGASVNDAFNIHFHRFMREALAFYRDKRLATAIQGIIPVGKPSVSTLISISDIIELLRKAFDPFDYGRNYTNTLNGIVWAIAAMALIRELRTSLGIPEAYEQAYEYIPAAYDLLVTKGPITSSETNRYLAHRECANDARDILLDMQVINHRDTEVGGELEVWLDTIEDKVEGYRTAYRSLTGIDLGLQQTDVVTGGPLSIEQKV